MDKSMDTSLENQEITVSLISTFAYGPAETLVRLADTTGFPGWSAPLTANEAHQLGVWLIEQAEIARLANLEREIDCAPAARADGSHYV